MSNFIEKSITNTNITACGEKSLNTTPRSSLHSVEVKNSAGAVRHLDLAFEFSLNPGLVVLVDNFDKGVVSYECTAEGDDCLLNFTICINSEQFNLGYVLYSWELQRTTICFDGFFVDTLPNGDRMEYLSEILNVEPLPTGFWIHSDGQDTALVKDPREPDKFYIYRGKAIKKVGVLLAADPPSVSSSKLTRPIRLIIVKLRRDTILRCNRTDLSRDVNTWIFKKLYPVSRKERKETRREKKHADELMKDQAVKQRMQARAAARDFKFAAYQGLINDVKSSVGASLRDLLGIPHNLRETFNSLSEKANGLLDNVNGVFDFFKDIHNGDRLICVALNLKACFGSDFRMDVVLAAAANIGTLYGLGPLKVVQMLHSACFSTPTFQSFTTPLQVLAGFLFVISSIVTVGKLPILKDVMNFLCTYGRAAIGFKMVSESIAWLWNFFEEKYCVFMYNIPLDEYKLSKLLPAFEIWLKNTYIVRKFTTEYITNSPDAIQAIDNTYEHGLRFEETLSRTKVLPDKLALTFFNIFKEIKNVWANSMASSARTLARRPRPTSVYFYGKPGTGKSEAVFMLSKHMLTHVDKHRLRSNALPGDLIYSRQSGQEFWDRFSSEKKVIFFDDYGSVVDTVTKPNKDFEDTIRVINVADYYPNMAAVTQKGQAACRPFHVMATSNTDMPKPESMTCVDAIRGRWNLYFEVRIKSQYGSVVNGRFKIDRTALPKECSLCGVRTEKSECCGKPPVAMTECEDIYEFLPYTVANHTRTYESINGHPVILNWKQMVRRYIAVHNEVMEENDARAAKARRDHGLTEDQNPLQGFIPLQSADSCDSSSDDDDWIEVRAKSRVRVKEAVEQAKKDIRNEQLEADRIMATLDSTDIIANNFLNYSAGSEVVEREMACDDDIGLAEYTEEYHDASPTPSLAAKFDFTSKFAKIHTYVSSMRPTPTQCGAGLLAILGVASMWAIYRYSKQRSACPLEDIEHAEDLPTVKTCDTCELCKEIRQIQHGVGTINNFNRNAVAKKMLSILMAHTGSLGNTNKWSAMYGKFILKESILGHVPSTMSSGDPVTKKRVTVVTGDATAASSGDPVTKKRVDSLRGDVTVEAEREEEEPRTVGPRTLLAGALAAASTYKIIDDVAEYASLQSKNTLEVATNIMNKNSVFVSGGFSADRTLSTNGLFLGGTTMLINAHMWSKLHPEYMINIYNVGCISPAFSVSKQACVTMEITHAKLGYRDLVAVKLPKQVRSFPNILKHFISVKELGKITHHPVAITTLRQDASTQVISPLIQVSNKIKNIDSIPIRLDSGDFVKVASLLEYECSNFDGMCGSPVSTHSDASNGKICAFHMAGQGDRGYGVPINREMLEEVFKALDNDRFTNDVPSFQGRFSPDTTDVTPIPGLRMTGSVEPIPTATKTMIVPSIVQDLLGPVTTIPAMLKPFTNKQGEYKDPLLIGVAKYGQRRLEINENIADIALDDVYFVMRQNCNKLRVFTNEEMLMGSEQYPFIDSVKLGTSPGYPYVLKPGKLAGKKSWLSRLEDGETIVGSKEFWDDFHAMETLLLQGERPQTLAIAQTKDERRPIAKVEQGKTRIFTIVNFVLNILVRKYFGAFISEFKDGRIDNESGVGINVHSLDWTRLAYRLQSKGHHVIAGDFSNYDGSQNVYIMRGICSVINKLYNDEFSVVRETIIEELINPNLIVRNGVYALSGINTSGNAITVQLNGLVNMVLMRYAYLLLKHRKTGSLYNDFTQHVYMVQFGDDNVLNISDEVIDWFNQATITEALATIGITYTDEAKTGVLVKSRTLEEVKFLKRQFLRNGLVYTAPLEADVVNEMMLWVRNCKNTSENIAATIENIDSALTEAAAHGKAFYENMVQRVSFACDQVDIIYHFRSYDEMVGRLAEIGQTLASTKLIYFRSNIEPRIFSNFIGKVEGWRSAEHLYQANKILLSGGHVNQEEFNRHPPMEAKRLGKTFEGQLIRFPNKVHLDLLRECVIRKFSTPAHLEALREHSSSCLVENSTSVHGGVDGVMARILSDARDHLLLQQPMKRIVLPTDAYVRMQMRSELSTPDRIESTRSEEDIPVFPPVSYAQAVVRPMPLVELSEEEYRREVDEMNSGWEDIDLTTTPPLDIEEIPDPSPRTGERGKVMKLLDLAAKLVRSIRTGVEFSLNAFLSLISKMLKKIMKGCPKALKEMASDVMEFTQWLYEAYSDFKAGKYTEEELRDMAFKAVGRIASIAAIARMTFQDPGFSIFILINVLWEELIKRLLQFRVPGSSQFGVYAITWLAGFMLGIPSDPKLIIIIPIYTLFLGLLALIMRIISRGKCSICNSTTPILTDCCGKHLCDDCNEARQYVAKLKGKTAECPKCDEELIPPPSNFLPSLIFGLGEFALYMRWGAKAGFLDTKFILMRCVLVVFHVITGCTNIIDGFLQHAAWNISAFNPGDLFFHLCSYASRLPMKINLADWNTRGVYPSREFLFKLPGMIYQQIKEFILNILEAVRNGGKDLLNFTQCIRRAIAALSLGFLCNDPEDKETPGDASHQCVELQIRSPRDVCLAQPLNSLIL